MTYKIKHISFLLNGEREKVKCDQYGMFVFEIKKGSGSRYNSKKLSLSKPLKATEVVVHPAVKKGDPVITLATGEKMRVYLSGDHTHMVVEAVSILETHEIERQAKMVKDIENKAEKKKKPFDTTSLEGLFEDFPEW